MQLAASRGNTLNKPIIGLMTTGVAATNKYLVGLFPAANIDIISINSISYSYQPTVTLDYAGTATEKPTVLLGALYLIETKANDISQINDSRFFYNPTTFPTTLSSDVVNYIGDGNNLLFARQINEYNIADTIPLNIQVQKGYNLLAVLVCPQLYGYSTNASATKDVNAMLLVQGNSKYTEDKSQFER